MSSYVLVPGAWLGGWAWEEVAGRLRAAGHDVHPVTLTGLGDRAGLASSEVDLDTHVADVVEVIEGAGSGEVILVGHSYGGFPVTGAADRIPERLAKVVYVESGPMPAGGRQLDALPPDQRAAVEARVAASPGGWRLPLPSRAELGGPDGGAVAGLGDAEWARLSAGAVDHPFGSYLQPLRLTGNPARDALPHVLVTCMFPLDQVRAMLAEGHPYFAGFGGKQWEFAELPTGHWPMFSEPAKLAMVLDSIGRS